MENSTLNYLLKPIPITFSYQSQFIIMAGSDINLDAQVYLLYEIPIALLARRFRDNKFDNCKIMVHELNGCIVGPGLYQEWTNYIYASKNREEQNLELCRSQTNNMLYYRAIKAIRKGDPLLAWFSNGVECELTKSILSIDHFPEANTKNHCKFCMVNFEHSNILKSHFFFELCGKNLKFPKVNTPPSSSSSSCSSTSSFSFKNIHSAFSDVSKNDQKLENISPRSSSSSPLSITNESVKNDLGQLGNGVDWKITMLDGTQTVELNLPDEMGKHKKTHVCLFCGKIYNRKYGLKIHLRTHTGYKPLKCKVCSRPFSDPSNLNKHVRLHSQGDTPYRCPYCGKILVRKRDLDRHILSRHSSNTEDNFQHDDDLDENDEINIDDTDE
ncbi:unnamed protein product [Brachionus calyciflorus]|uniref:C2H2-type domain-containing protein n=1 Tax=Brachionus calyciflorus TaxID=104777 RepID=A0A813M297_9BILA|nr:unnamed protein product [Brachionus calyciflorus]